MEMSELVPDNLDTPITLVNGEKVETALMDIMEESTEGISEVPLDDPHVESSTNAVSVSIGTQTSITTHSPFVIEEMRSIQQLIRSKFGELNRTLTQHCQRTHRMLHHIRVHIDAFLRQQRPSLQRTTGTRSSRLPMQRSQHHQRSATQRSSASQTQRTQRLAAQRPGPPRSSSLGIAGQRSSVIHRRSARSLLHARDNPGFRRNRRAGTFGTAPFNLRNASTP